jgi:hypothetical protein
MVTRNRGDPPDLEVREAEVVLEGTAPLVCIPLGCFKQLPEEADEQVEKALELYRREDGEPGFPAGAFKKAVMDACKAFDKDTRTAVAAGFHVIGEPGSNMIRISGGKSDPSMEEYEFTFKRPKREVSRALPVFNKWQAVLAVQFMPKMVPAKRLEEFLNLAGAEIGIGHDRPDSGTFKVKAFNVINNERSKKRTNTRQSAGATR